MSTLHNFFVNKKFYDTGSWVDRPARVKHYKSGKVIKMSKTFYKIGQDIENMTIRLTIVQNMQ